MDAVESYFNRIKGKRAAVLGIGISNTPLIRLLSDKGVSVTACDKNMKVLDDKLKAEFEKRGIELRLGEGYLDNLNHDIIFKTPGMRYDLPVLESARRNGSVITSEMEVFFDLCPAKIYAVTGSDGKTTTTTLIYEMLKKQGYNCYLGGNIGKPLLPEIEYITKDDKIVVELSSFQLHTMRRSANVSVVTNLSPNHLDIHKSMEEYINAKKNIFLYQSEKDKLVINFDNDITKEFKSEAKGRVLYFSYKNKLKNGICLDDDGYIVSCENNVATRLFSREDILFPGNHNVENYMAACAAVLDDVEPKNMQAVASELKGIEHRIEFVREKDGVKYYNNSIASSPTRAIVGLNAFDQKVIMIAGGYDKKIPFDELGPAVQEKVKHLILSGNTAHKIQKAVEAAGNCTPITVCDSFELAVKTAAELAKEGDVVILNPACASFDAFKNFEERGKRFKELVNAL